MKLISVLVAASCLTAQAFGVSQRSSLIKKGSNPALVSGLRTKGPSAVSPLFRDESVVRGGAVPGWAAYNEALDKSPITAKACTSALGFFLGDLLAQLFIVKSGIDIKRLVTLSVFGFIYHGPSGHYFYNWLDDKIQGTDGASVAAKVAIDQVFWCPIFMCVFFTYLGLCAGDSFGTIGAKIRADLFTAMQGSWKVWPFVHAINFKFISTKHRLVFINGVQIVFNMFLSLIGSS